MNKTTLKLLAAATALFALSSAHAQEATPELYAEVGYSQLYAQESDSMGTFRFSPKTLTSVFGYQFAPNMAVEGMLGVGTGKGSVKFNGVGTGVQGKVKTALGVFFKPSVSVSDGVDLFGRIGWVYSELELAAPGASATERDDSLAYGVGANFNLSKTSYIQANWMNYYKKDGFKIDGFTVAYGVRF